VSKIEKMHPPAKLEHGDGRITEDDIDRRIVSALRADEQLTMSALGVKVGLSASPCWTRVKRLGQAGVITGYVALLDHAALGLPGIVFVEITLDYHDEPTLKRFGREWPGSGR
jgi:Lrp/AsnC family transcriptional regulator, leucine-responsive regulatory protein